MRFSVFQRCSFGPYQPCERTAKGTCQRNLLCFERSIVERIAGASWNERPMFWLKIESSWSWCGIKNNKR